MLLGSCAKNAVRPFFSPEIEESPEPAQALADRTGDFLRVTCPHCRHTKEFPAFDMVYIFVCHECGEPVAVIEHLH